MATIAFAQADAAEPPLAEVVVRGERSAQSQTATASSVVVVTARDLEAQRSLDRVDDLLGQVPNVQVGSGTEGVAIRGQDTTGALRELSAFLGGTRPRVTLQVDGRPLSYFEYVFGASALWDVSQVEVFRSPQTTTQGRNSTAGAVFVETADPEYAWHANGRLLAGTFDRRQASLTVTGPIVDDQLAFRLSSDWRRARNASDMANAIVGADLNRDEAGFVRLKMLAQPAAVKGLRIETSLVHQSSEAPQFDGIQVPFTARSAPVPDRTNGVYRMASNSLTAVSEWAPSAEFAWRTTVSVGDGLVRRFGLPGLGRTRATVRDLTFETVLETTRRGPFSWLGGVNRTQTRQRQAIDITALRLGTGEFRDQQQSTGLFGEARWHPADDWHVALGVRHQRDRQDREGVLTRPGAPIGLDYDRSFDAWLPKLSVSHDFTDGLTAGVLVQRAFNPGGTTISLVTCLPDDFEAETLRNYEGFLRTTSADGTLRFKANVFRSDLRDAQRPQLTTLVPCGITPGRTLIGNAPSARTEGTELQLDWLAAAKVEVSLGVAWLSARVQETERPDDPTLGRRFQRAPTVSGTARITWRPSSRTRLSARLSANSDYFSDDANTAALRVGGSSVVDLDVSHDVGRYTLSGYARNAFDRFAMTYLFTPTFGTARDPRELGFSVTSRF